MENKEQKIEELLTRGVAEVIDKEHLKARLLSGETLRIKLGIDPTSPNLHLGRSIPLLKLRDFQELGHKAVLIVGDFTGQIGDTSDKESERPMLSEDLVKKNMTTYLDQAYKILDPKKTEVHYNSKWLSQLNLRRIGELSTWFSLNEFISRENIKKRLNEGKRISLRELLYPLMQGYDSIMVDADVELGGTDQRFNLLAGRESQRHMVSLRKEADMIRENIGGIPRDRTGNSIGPNLLASEPQDILMTNLILGTDSRKMSSSWGNTINLTETPNKMFKKVARDITDDLIVNYFIHCTRVPMKEISKIAEDIVTGGSPHDAKLCLAEEIVKFYYDSDKAENARSHYEAISKGEIPEDIESISPSPSPSPSVPPDYEPALEGYENIESLIARIGYATSKSDARRKIEQGGVTLDNEKINGWSRMFTKEDNGKILRVGKEDPVKIVF